MFKVGDLVRSLKRKDGGEYYAWTHSDVVCRVSHVDVDYMVVFINEGQFGGPFRVKCSTFNLETVDLENK